MSYKREVVTAVQPELPSQTNKQSALQEVFKLVLGTQ